MIAKLGDTVGAAVRGFGLAVLLAVALSAGARAQEQAAGPPIPDGPSLAVLPFVNMSTNRHLQYLSDGVTEDVISALSAVSSLLVIDADSSFRFARAPLPQTGRLLGVRHVLKGRLGRIAGSLRIQVELYDAARATQLWTEEFMAPLDHVFSLEDELVEKVLSEIEAAPTGAESERIRHVRTTNWNAYDADLLGRGTLFRPTRQNVLSARRTFERAVDLDPAYAGGLAGVSETYAIAAQLGYTQAVGTAIGRARRFAERAVAADESLPAAHRALAAAALLSGDYDVAVSASQRAVALAPNDADANLFLGFYLAWAGRGQDAVTPIEKAIRLNPFSEGPDQTFLGFAYASAGRYDEAIEVFAAEKETGDPMPAFALAHWTAALIESGQTVAAQTVAQEIMARFPTFTLSAWAATLRYKEATDAERHLNALRLAGLPD